jgi:mannitol-1-phosphate 5-dehydrogenase
MKKLVLFGAGKIGRSFVGQLFSRSSYEVVFVDILKPVIEALNKRGIYNVIIKGDKEEAIKVTNVRGVLATDKEKVVEEVSTANIVATSVLEEQSIFTFFLFIPSLRRVFMFFTPLN